MNNEERFIKCIKELGHFVVDFSLTVNDPEAGRWRMAKQELPTGDIKALLYRSITVITLIYNHVGKDYAVEMDLSLRKSSDAFLYEATRKYARDHDIELNDFDPSVLNEVIIFRTVDELETYIYHYLLPSSY